MHPFANGRRKNVSHGECRVVSTLSSQLTLSQCVFVWRVCVCVCVWTRRNRRVNSNRVGTTMDATHAVPILEFWRFVSVVNLFSFDSVILRLLIIPTILLLLNIYEFGYQRITTKIIKYVRSDILTWLKMFWHFQRPPRNVVSKLILICLRNLTVQKFQSFHQKTIIK